MLKVENGALADTEQGDLRMNEVTPFNMALHPGDHTLVVGTGSAGVKVLDVAQQTSGPPTLTLVSGAWQATRHLQCNNKHVLHSVRRRAMPYHIHHVAFVPPWASRRNFMDCMLAVIRMHPHLT